MARPTEPGTARVRNGLCLAALVLFWAFAMYCLARGHNDRTSDEADGLLEAQDLARGNVFLSGWTVQEDSFYTLYLPVSAVLVRGFGLAAGIIIGVSWGAYVLMGVGAFLAARCRGVPPFAVALVLFLFFGLLTPFQSSLYFYYMGHALTMAHVLLALAALRWGLRGEAPGRRRGGLLLFGGLLFMAVAGDPLAVYAFVVPLLGAVLLVGARRREWRTGAAVALAAVAPVLLAKGLAHFLATQGFYITNINSSFWDNFATRGRLPFNIYLYYNSWLALAGVYLPGWPALSLALTALRLAGAGAAVLLTVRRLAVKTVTDWDDYFLDALLVLGIAVNQIEFVSYANLFGLSEARYLMPGAVYAAILAARRFAPLLVELWRRAVPPARVVLLGAGLAAIALAVGPLWAINETPINDAETHLAEWLESQGLRSGYGGYWQANILRVVSHEAVQVAPVYRRVDLKLAPFDWLAKADWFRQPANFLVYQTETELASAASATLGPPSAVHDVAGFHVLVWDHDIHNQLAPPGDLQLSFPLDLMKFALSFDPAMKHNADGSWTDDQPRPATGILVYGPYLPLPAGHYTARFTLSAADAAAGDAVVLDVATRHGTQVLGKVRVAGPQLPGAGGAQTFTVPFASAGPGQAFEFRVWKTGQVKLTINALELDQSGP
jgi:hypothetical protein